MDAIIAFNVLATIQDYKALELYSWLIRQKKKVDESKNEYVKVTQKRLAARFGVGLVAIRNWLDNLELYGLISRDRNHKPHRIYIDKLVGKEICKIEDADTGKLIYYGFKEVAGHRSKRIYNFKKGCQRIKSEKRKEEYYDNRGGIK